MRIATKAINADHLSQYAQARDLYLQAIDYLHHAYHFKITDPSDKPMVQEHLADYQRRVERINKYLSKEIPEENGLLDGIILCDMADEEAKAGNSATSLVRYTQAMEALLHALHCEGRVKESKDQIQKILVKIMQKVEVLQIHVADKIVEKVKEATRHI